MCFLSDYFSRWAAVICLLGLACSQAFADGELKNGDFVETMRMRDDPNEQLLPKHWFASLEETTGNPWVRVEMEEGPGVEIKAGDVPQYLYQDVTLDGTKSWTLKWKCKGEGSASVGVIPRDDNQTIFPGTNQALQLTESLEEHEMTIAAPAETKILRITLVPGANSTVIFQDMQLTSSD